GRARVTKADQGLRKRMSARIDTEAALRRAAERPEEAFVLHYQPIVDAKRGTVVAAEALVRWRHPERGLLPPAEFIGVAEETGLIVPIGEWVLNEALVDAGRWRRTEAGRHVAVSVNL